MMEMMSTSVHLAVKSQLRDDRCSAADLRKWVAAVAFGRTVHVDRGGGRPAERQVFLRPTFKVCARKVFFTRAFSKQYRVVELIFREIAGHPGSQWRVVGAGSGAAGAQVIDTVANLVQLLGGIIAEGNGDEDGGGRRRGRAPGLQAASLAA